MQSHDDDDNDDDDDDDDDKNNNSNYWPYRILSFKSSATKRR